ncbi:hypothetical protein ACSL103130_12350 [Actinomyces slackii]|uniref:Uncharacterized protein conserved in bacteria n=1 Tax=Actinomyces slackii TaxID=52774 RepID=A0A3S4WG96_9ACTO|nr:hypothetical protein [Actinomyces slackii]VEG74231.1 Uncharacterized protein conserved in bacteria [Actinomyces slackii]
MGVNDAPQWLLPAFSRSVRALGATADAEQIRAAGEHLVALWSTPDRRFHTLRHVIDMLARVDELADESHDPDLMRVATWYHGCVFSADTVQVRVRNGGEDEMASAQFAAQDLQALGVPPEAVERVCSLIVNLKRHTLTAEDIDAMALIDADLGTLAVDPQTYKEYLRLLREEYAHIPQAEYLRARLAITTRLLGRDRLFRSPLGERWELPARQNLEAEAARVSAKLEALSPGDAEQCAQVGHVADPSADQPTSRQGSAADPSLCSLSEEPDDGPRSCIEQRPRGASADEPGQTQTQAQTQAQAEHSASPLPPRVVAPAGAPRLERSGAPSAASPRTPADGVPVGGLRKEGKGMSHAASMESCIEDLDRLLSAPRAGEERGISRHAQAAEERERMAETVRQRAQAARAAREARTGEIAPITEEIVDDGAGDL